MTALAVHASHVAHESHLSWPRIGAWSGSFSLHLLILALLLTPPVALEVVRQVEKQQHYRIIPPEKVTPEPALPEPEARKPPVVPITHIKTPPVTAPPIVDIPNVMGRATPVIEAPPAIESRPAIQDSEPSAIQYGHQTKVAYPIESLRNREQGTVTLRVLVSAAGLVQMVEIEKSSGYLRLDRAARDAVKGWSFHPAIRNGVAQSAWALVPVTFNLQQL